MSEGISSWSPPLRLALDHQTAKLCQQRRDYVPALIMAPVTSGKSLLEQVEERGMWPSNSTRWCTSGTKRGPIERELRRYLKAHPRFEGRLINALGLRRDESRDRARRIPWRRNERMSVAGREVFDWLPVFELTTEHVFRVIAEAGHPNPPPGFPADVYSSKNSFSGYADAESPTILGRRY